MLTLLFTQVPFIFDHYQADGHFENDSDLELMIPAFATVLLVLNFIVNLAYITYIFVKKVRYLCTKE
jgi:hypothetical protein